jgi:protein-tyrosine-phosphatase
MKKILFVCYGNVGRSQWAEAFYNHYTKSKNAFSAGTDPKTPLKYPRLPDDVCLVMREQGIDISCQKVKFITQEHVNEADEIYVLCKRKLSPNFLLNSDKVTFWQIPDPFNMNIEAMRKIRDLINKNVQALISAQD